MNLWHYCFDFKKNLKPKVFLETFNGAIMTQIENN
jgi:hypothetical protein